MADIYYFDISKAGRDFTGKRDISIVTNEQAVSESIMNILNTKPGERVMHPTFGCNLEQYLFDPIDDITTIYIQKEIEDALNMFETRINQLKVIITPLYDDNAYDVQIIFSIKVISKQQTLSFQLVRIR